MTVCLYAGTPSPYLETPVGGAGTLRRVIDFVGSIPDRTRVLVLASERPEGLPGDWDVVEKPAWTVSDLVGALADAVTSPDDALLFTHLDQPLLNASLTRRLVDRHQKFHADYTFADGYPVGLAPELLRGRCLSYLRELAQQVPGGVKRDSLFTVISKDMNRFDIETELSRTDQRLMRLVLAVDTLANLEVCQALADGAPEEIDQWPDHAELTRAKHRSRPRYVSVQVIEQDVHEVSYSPYPGLSGRVLMPGAIMKAARFDGLMAELAELSPEAVVTISAWGEVGLHPNAIRLVDSVVSRAGLQLIVETSGVGWGSGVREELFSRDGVTVIVALDTNDPAAYRNIRGEGFSEATEFAEAAVATIPDRAYVQAVRCDLTDKTLDNFYRYWSEKTSNVIIQKYDSFSGRLPDRRLGDLAPLKRFPCWHAQRDMTVLVDGCVPVCREDLQRTRILGNVFTDGLAAAWEAGAEVYEEHIAGSYPGVCERCDEYYTFNY